MRTVLVTGADGMLGSEVVRQLKRESDVVVVPTTVRDMDITDVGAVRRRLEGARPTHIVHTAAFTQVDTAERERLRAFMVNAEGTKNLAFFCREIGIELVLVSTDYVFSGDKGSPYLETDPTGPINAYGESKLLAERYVQELLGEHKIVRTSWLNGLGSSHNRNFIETMLRLAETRSNVSVVMDQRGRPTFTFDLARALVLLLSVRSYGIFHVTNTGECSWYDLARAIFEHSGHRVEVTPITSDQFRSLARRPRYSVLANERFRQLGLNELPDWRHSLGEYFRLRGVASSQGLEMAGK